MVFATELLFIKPLHGFVIDARNCVAIRQQLISIVIAHYLKDSGIADAAALQEQRTPLHFRINFVPSEPGQK